MRLIARLVDRCARRAAWVALIAAALAAASAIYTVGHFAIDTDTAKLISPELPWRQREAAFDAAFPQRMDPIAVVVDALTPELAEQATASLAQRLASDTRRFRSVRRPDGGPFFEREGLLFLSVDELARTTQRLISAQPLLGSLAADPSLRGVMDALSLIAAGAQRDPSALAELAQPLAVLAEAFDAAAAGSAAPVSWRTMIDARPADPHELRRFVVVQPVLDYTALEPGVAATNAIRTAARDLGLDAHAGVRVRLTGPVPLADEEFKTLEQGAGVDAALMLGALVSLLWLALRSLRLVAAVLATLAVGLALTAAFGLAVFGRFNLISVAFAVLFVGLGVDFGIQFCVAYRASRVASDDLRTALTSAGASVGSALALAAASTAAAFYAFVPTAYVGVSELGVIAGTGMVIAFVASVTLLPALVMLLGAPAERRAVGVAAFEPVDDAILRHRRALLALAAIAAVASIAALPWLPFDFNPLHLKSPTAESVATLNDLAQDPLTTPNTIDVLTPSLADAVALSHRLAALSEVDHALTLADFVPAQQDEKLSLIEDAALLLDPVLHPAHVAPAPSDAEVVDAMRRASASLAQIRGAAPPIAAAAARLASALRRLADGTPAQRAAARTALIPGLATMLDQLRSALAAGRVTIDGLPPDLVRDWISVDGRARVEASPAGDANDNATLARFVDAVRRVAPDATGAPVSIRESSRTIIEAFVQAGAWALVAIVAILAVTLRQPLAVLLTLAPLLLAALATLGVCALTGFALNFENVIALPLLFGIGVAFDIYFVVAWRSGQQHVLASSLSRAVLFSALTTGTAFGSLWLSNHPGTSSMGKLLVLSLAATLLSVLLFLPALLRSVRVRS